MLINAVFHAVMLSDPNPSELFFKTGSPGSRNDISLVFETAIEENIRVFRENQQQKTKRRAVFESGTAFIFRTCLRSRQ
jgi:hypothetical protein